MRTISALLVAGGLYLGACGPVWIGTDADGSPTGILRTVWTDLDHHYALFGAKQVDWNAVAAEFFPQVNEDTTQTELWSVTTSMLDRLRDPHVQLNNADRTRYFNSGFHQEAATERFSTWIIETIYLRNGYRFLGDNRLIFGTLADTSLAYLWISTFSGDTDFAKDLDEVVTAANGMAGLIIDLRANGGGSTQNFMSALSALVDKDVTYLRWHERSGKRHDDFTPLREMTVIHDPARPVYRGRLAVLVDNWSGSSSDHFHYVAKEFLPNATTFGERTIGNFGSVENYKVLPNGWMYTYSAREALSLDGVPLDAMCGVEPDVPVAGSQDELRLGHDLVLDAAVAHLQSH